MSNGTGCNGQLQSRARRVHGRRRRTGLPAHPLLRLLALPPRHRRPCGFLASSAAVGRGRLRVRMARTESTGVAVGFRAPQFELPEPLTGNLWTLDDFYGNPALLVRHSSSPPEFFSSPVVDNARRC
ncbi:uncharacterized protein LOC120667615 [Panicum virgatum]|uniref:uncharacterized protein LOC120667615 n=1 Tax=Panicum virgatum TaxID=38727 RepID=UPI0019D5E7B5|nr:uncharacterized protein LOC120667615 [Panicum virgatum]